MRASCSSRRARSQASSAAATRVASSVSRWATTASTLAAFPSAAGLSWALAGLLAMGTGLELLQVALPRRQGSWLDAGANALGLSLGGVVLLRRRTRAG